MNLFDTLENTAARGAAGLTAEARATLAEALGSLRRAEGGFAGFDGRADAYYSFFAWLSLRALDAPYDREGLCAYMEAQRQTSKPVDAQCAQILLAAEGRGSRLSWLDLVAALFHGDSRGMYGAFLLILATGDVPRWTARLAWLRQRRLFAGEAAGRLPTPRLAAGVVLATLAGETEAGLLSVVAQRRCAGGGFASAAGAPADLLATAVSRFSIGCRLSAVGNGLPLEIEPQCKKGDASDLAFVEACWLEDGLFGASPDASRGDAEHTFYGLLALGTCR